MADSVKIKSGSKKNMPRLANRELAWVRDEEALYIGTSTGNLKIAGFGGGGGGDSSDMEAIAEKLLGVRGGCARLVDTDDDGLPDTLFLADHYDPDHAVNVWRFNAAGWGVSNTGYDGEFVMGATIENGIVADFIKVGAMSADLIKAGMLRAPDGRFSINLDTGELIASDYATQEDLASVQAAADANATELGSLKQRVTTTLDLTNGLKVEVERIVENGVDKVKTSKGYSFSDEGLIISENGSQIYNKINHDGMRVDRLSEDGASDNMLTADADGVQATDLKAKNYLLIGKNSRIQDFVDEDGVKGGAMFWVAAD